MTTNSDIHALYRQDFRSFVLKVFWTLHPGDTCLENWHIDAIIWHLLEIIEGRCARLMINMPPRTLKSMIVSVAWPAFILGHDPTRNIFVVSHSLDLAEALHADFRKVVEADWYRTAFPTMKPAADKNTTLVFRTSQGGARKAFSVESKITGQGSHYTILDDPLDASDALNEAACEKTNNWIVNVLMNRFNRASEGVMVLVMQRVALNDPAGFLREIEPWDILSLPAIADQDYGVPIGPGKCHYFGRGELLHPELLNQEFLESRRRGMRPADYSAQFLQHPLPFGGGLIDISLFGRYKKLPVQRDTRFLSIDAASGSDSGSFSVIQVWQITDGGIYLMDSHRGRWNFPELKTRTIKAQIDNNADFILIEYASNGEALSQDLGHHYPREIQEQMIQWYKPRYSKVIRMDLAMVPIDAGQVFFPEKAAFLQLLLDELQAFPNGIYDDQVDALSQALWFFSHEYKNNLHNPEYKARSRVIAKW